MCIKCVTVFTKPNKLNTLSFIHSLYHHCNHKKFLNQKSPKYSLSVKENLSVNLMSAISIVVYAIVLIFQRLHQSNKNMTDTLNKFKGTRRRSEAPHEIEYDHFR